MTFVNEEHSNVHRKRHEMVLNLEIPKNNVMDQTPTPTLFLRNCEEVGLFQDLQNVNPFDDTFKKALEKSGNSPSSQPTEANSDDTLHTPNILPHITITRVAKTPAICELPELSNEDGDELINTKKCGRKRKSDCDEFAKVLSRREVNRAAQYRSRLKKKELSQVHERLMVELRQQNDRLLIENEQLKDELRKARQILEKHRWCIISSSSSEIVNNVIPPIDVIKRVVLPASSAASQMVNILPKSACPTINIPGKSIDFSKNVDVDDDSKEAISNNPGCVDSADVVDSKTTEKESLQPQNPSTSFCSGAITIPFNSNTITAVKNSNITSLFPNTIAPLKSIIPINTNGNSIIPLNPNANTPLKSTIPCNSKTNTPFKSIIPLNPNANTPLKSTNPIINSMSTIPVNSTITSLKNAIPIKTNSQHVIIPASPQAFLIPVMPVQTAAPIQIILPPSGQTIGRSIAPKPSGFNESKKDELAMNANSCGIESRNKALVKKPRHAGSVNLLKRRS